MRNSASAVTSSATRRPLGRVLASTFLLAAAVAARADDLGAPTLEWQDAAGNKAPAAALDLSIDSKVSGLVAQTRVVERFRNDSPGFLEGQYRLPLPEGAAVYRLTLHIGSRVIEGEIREKAQAQGEYQAAALQGKRVSLVEQQKSNLFRTAVANVAPGETVEVEIAYWQQVTFQDGRFSLSLPLATPTAYSQQLAVGTPDQGPATLTGGLADRGAGSTHLTVDLTPGMTLQSIGSETHKVSIEHRGEHYAVRLLESEAEAVNQRDFNLNWAADPSAEPAAALFVEHAADADYAMVMMLAPSQAKESLARELILVIDTSGSMSGTSIAQAKAALLLALDHLQPGDRLNVIEFNSVTRPLFKEPVEVGPATLDAARGFISRLQADGGTEMLPALDAALAGAAPPGYLRQVVFATDGAVDDEDGLYVLIEQSLGQARLFPVGIGDAPNAHFIEQSARMGRGAPMVIRRIEDVGARMQELFDKLDRPALRDVQLDWPALSESFPSRLPDLYSSEPLIAVARLARASGSLQVAGQMKNAGWQRALQFSPGGSASGIAQLWARRKIDDLEDQLRRSNDEASIRPQLIQVALAHHLVTRYTSLIAVDKTPVRDAQQTLNGIEVNSGDAIAMARGATAAPLLALSGLLGLLLVLVALWLPRRSAVSVTAVSC